MTTGPLLDSAGATHSLGRRLGAAARAGDVILLEGALGAGKTVLVQGIAEGLGCAEPASSPTFVLVRHHAGRLLLVHADLYRVEGPAQVQPLGLLELAEAGLLVVEWPDRDPGLAVADRLHLRLRQSARAEEAREVDVLAAPAHLAAELDRAS